jgi:thiol peroxidase
MKRSLKGLALAAVFFLFPSGCMTPKNQFPVSKESIAPGGIVYHGSQQFHLLGTPIRVGDSLPDVLLVDAFSMEEISLAQLAGKVTIISIVPSLDTKVCEAQTHYLGEQGDRLPAGIKRVTISRDTPFAQKRFAEEADLTDIQYLSDYRDGSFGMSTGFLLDKIKLLSRGVMVTDKAGVIRYIQIVPQLGELPDLEKAFDFAESLDRNS